jgi:hypothetical protein
MLKAIELPSITSSLRLCWPSARIALDMLEEFQARRTP